MLRGVELPGNGTLREVELSGGWNYQGVELSGGWNSQGGGTPREWNSQGGGTLWGVELPRSGTLRGVELSGGWKPSHCDIYVLTFSIIVFGLQPFWFKHPVFTQNCPFSAIRCKCHIQKLSAQLHVLVIVRNI